MAPSPLLFVPMNPELPTILLSHNHALIFPANCAITSPRKTTIAKTEKGQLTTQACKFSSVLTILMIFSLIALAVGFCVISFFSTSFIVGLVAQVLLGMVLGAILSVIISKTTKSAKCKTID